ncbi:MAG: lipopolysaccharide biosynthesis protein [Bacteroidetes bacterium]|nr:lipopolysaccharide biosynthesis protein [Bacteroidota bacterium]
MTYFTEITNKYIKNNEMFSRFMKVFSVDFLVRGANFLLIYVFLYLMTKDEFGVYGYLYSFAMTVSGILNFGFYISMTKLYADTNSDSNKQSSMLFTVTTALISLVTISMLIVYFLKIDVDFFSLLNKTNGIDASTYLNYRGYVFVAILSMIFTNFLSFYFVSSEQIKKLQLFNLIRFFLSNGISVLILYYSNGDNVLQRLAITYSMELLLTIIFGVFLFKRFIFRFDNYYLRKSFKIGMPIMVSSLMYSVVNFGDKFFVVKYSGINDFAVYNLGFLLATIVLIVYQSFNFVWIPLFLKEKDLVVLRRKTRRYIILIFFSFLLLGVLLWFFTLFALKINIIPATYNTILYLLPILILSQIFAALIGILVNFMTYFEKTYIQVFVGAGLSLVGYFLFDFLGKNYFTIGVAVGLLILNIISFVFYYFRVEYYINNRLKE